MRLIGQKSTKPVRRPPASPSSSNVFSYYSSRPSSGGQNARNYDQPKQHTKWVTRLRKIPVLAATIAIIFSLFYILWIDTDPRIEVIPRSQTPLLLQDMNVYRAAGQNILRKSLFNRLKITIDTNRVGEEMQANFPELADVAVTTPVASHRLLFQIQPTTPALVLSSHSEAFVIDKRGRVVVKASEVPELSQLNLPYVIDNGGIELSVGKFVLPTENVGFIAAVVFQLRAKSIEIAEITLPLAANELHIKPVGQQYFVKFNMAGNARLQAGAFISVKARLEREGKHPADYIDVRVEEKAFYR